MKNRQQPACKIVKMASGAGTGKLTRIDNKVFATLPEGQTLFEKTFESNRAAKKFMGETSTI